MIYPPHSLLLIVLFFMYERLTARPVTLGDATAAGSALNVPDIASTFTNDIAPLIDGLRVIASIHPWTESTSADSPGGPISLYVLL